VGTVGDQIAWSWKKGSALSIGDLGTPGATTYALCIYDSTAGAYDLATSVVAAPSAAWRYRDKAWFYLDDSGEQDGVFKIKLKTGAQDKSAAQFNAEGPIVPLPAPHSATEYFDQSPTVRAQLVAIVANEVHTCWTSDFAPAETVRNQPSWFAAK